MSTIPATPPSSPAYYSSDDAKIYVSTATLQLKLNIDDYVWHTTVLTPQTPEAPAQVAPPAEIQESEVYEPECQTTCQQQQQQQQQEQQAPPRTRQRWTPVELHGVPETIYTVLGNFMSSERYDSECNWLMTNTLANHGVTDADLQTTQI